MSDPKYWGRTSLDNEEAVLQYYWRPDTTKKVWQARGTLDADNARVDVKIYPEHRRQIERAGYTITWDVAGEISGDDVPVRLVENDNGRRRIAAVLKLDTVNEWIEVRQQAQTLVLYDNSTIVLNRR